MSPRRVVRLLGRVSFGVALALGGGAWGAAPTPVAPPHLPPVVTAAATTPGPVVLGTKTAQVPGEDGQKVVLRLPIAKPTPKPGRKVDPATVVPGPSRKALTALQAALSPEKMLGQSLRELIVGANDGNVTGLDFAVGYNDHGVLDVTYSLETMGAYPDVQVAHRVFDTRSGTAIHAADCFAADKLGALAATLDLPFRAEVAKLVAEHTDDLAGIADDLANRHYAVADLDGFAVTSSGLVFTFAYDFPHVALALEPEGRYPMSWTELAPYLRSDAPVAAVAAVAMGSGGTGVSTAASPALASALALARDGSTGAQAARGALIGAHVQDWKGWVAWTGGEAGARFVVAYAEDPYATPAPEAGGPFARADSAATVLLEGLAVDPGSLVAGQVVTLSGTIAHIEGPRGVRIELTQGAFAPGPSPLTEPLSEPQTPPQTPTAGGPEGHAGVVAAIERTACFGTCPIYAATLYADGKLAWRGVRYVATIGEAELATSSELVARVRAALARAQVATLREAYTAVGVTDQPSAVVTFAPPGAPGASGATRKIRHYHGDFSAPPKLSILEAQLDRLLGTDRWIKPSPR